MLGITLNEQQIIDEALLGKYDRDKIVVVINLLIKHYYLEGIENNLELTEQILNYLKQNYKNYKRAKWESFISKKVSTFINLIKRNKIKKVEIVNIEKIDITKKELEKIKELDNLQLEKLAFILLMYAKIFNKINDNQESWTNVSYSVIFKESKIYMNATKKLNLLNELYTKKYITQRKKNNKTNIQVCYIDNESDIEMTITDFNNVVNDYIVWRNTNTIKCKKCGKSIKKKNNRNEYCPECAKENKLEKYRKYNKKRVKNEKQPPIEK